MLHQKFMLFSSLEILPNSFGLIQVSHKNTQSLSFINFKIPPYDPLKPLQLKLTIDIDIFSHFVTLSLSKIEESIESVFVISIV